MPKLDVNAIKNRVPNVQAAIKSTLKVDAGVQNTLDIIAASLGFKDFHLVSSMSKMKYFDIRCNLGSTENPFYVVRDIGELSEDYQAKLAAENILMDCAQNQTWIIFKDGQPTEMQVITTSDDSSNDPFGYLDAIDCVIPYHNKYVIFDHKGIIEGDNSFDDSYEKFMSEDAIEEWSGYLIMAEQVLVNDLPNYEDDQDAIFHALSKNGISQIHGRYHEIVDALKELDGQIYSYHLFVELNRV